MMFNQVEGTTTNAREVRRLLSGKRTKSLYIMLWRRNKMERLRQGLKAFDYDYDYERLEIVDRYQRMALIDKVAGLSSLELDADSECSNGMNVVLFAFHHGATAVIISGINPNSAGHVYNQAELKRHHTDMDMCLIKRLMELNYPLYTADPDVGLELACRFGQAQFLPPYPTTRGDARFNRRRKLVLILKAPFTRSARSHGACDRGSRTTPQRSHRLCSRQNRGRHR